MPQLGSHGIAKQFMTTSEMSGAGNRFTVIDNRLEGFAFHELQFIAPIVTNQDKTEGFIAINPPSNDIDDFEMLFFNPDGSHGAMCGNGGRCAVEFAVTTSHHSPRIGERSTFTCAGVQYRAQRLGTESWSLEFFAPKILRENYLITLGNQPKATGFLEEIRLSFVNNGSDHAVIFLPDLNFEGKLSEFPLHEFAPSIRYHTSFEPNGTNCNIYELESAFSERPCIRLRTYERGVEAETGACGTGALATGLIAMRRHELGSSIDVIPTSGEILTIYALPDSVNPERILLCGPAKILSTQSRTIPTFSSETVHN